WIGNARHRRSRAARSHGRGGRHDQARGLKGGRIMVLDSGPLGDAWRKRGHVDVERLTLWRHPARANGGSCAMPAMAAYEVRRGLLLTGRLRASSVSMT